MKATSYHEIEPGHLLQRTIKTVNMKRSCIGIGVLLYLSWPVMPTWSQLLTDQEAQNQDTQADEQVGKGNQWAERVGEEKEIEKAESLYGSDSNKLANAVNDLALMYKRREDFLKAERLYNRSLRIAEKGAAPDKIILANILNNLAELYRAMAQYNKAEPLLLRAIAIYEEALGQNNPELRSPLNNLALVYDAQEQHAKVEALLLRVVAIEEGTKGASGPHPFVLDNLGDAYRKQGRFHDAELLFRRALAMEEEAWGENHPDVAVTLGNLGLVYEDQGKYDEAEKFFQRYITLTEKALGERHTQLAIGLNNLALLYETMGQYARAEPLLERALQIRRTVLGPNHPDVGRSLIQLAIVRGALHRPAEALALYRDGLALETRFIKDVLSRTEEAHHSGFVVKTQGSYHTALSLITNFLSDDPKALTVGADLVLSRKSLTLDSQARTHEALLLTLPTRFRSVYDAWQERKGRLGKLTLHPPTTLSATAYQDQLTMLQTETTELEGRLIAQNPLLASTIRSDRATLTTVSQQLPPKSVLIEFVKFAGWNWEHFHKGVSRYGAFLVHPFGGVQFVNLGEAEPLENAIRTGLARFREGTWQTLESQQQAASDLYSRLWEPLRPAVGDATTVILSTDGLVNLVPFAALQNPDGKFLIEDYTLMTVTSGRDLVKEANALPSQSALFLAADPAFDGAPLPKTSSIAAAPVQATGEQEPTHQFTRLEGTAEELSLVPPLIPGSIKVAVNGKAATEDAVLRAKRPRVMHLATHGFFEDRPALLGTGLTSAVEGTGRVPPGYDNPLLRSGLAFAGANHATRMNDRNDGILTAWEVSAMDLFGTELVVLSACDTGVGEARTGEGVYGLRRAFALSGVQNLIMSLWPVWDKQAVKQMTTFYTSYGQGMHPALALRKAQLERIKWMRAYLGAAPPSLWAPFMVQVSGSLRTLHQP